MRTYRLKFDNKEQATETLLERFPEWDGIQTPFQVGNDCLVVVDEPIEVDEQGEPLPNKWVGVHVDLMAEETTEYKDFEIEVSTPAHSFGQ